MSADPLAELEGMRAALAALEPLAPEGRARALRWLAETLEAPDAVGAMKEDGDAQAAGNGRQTDGSTPGSAKASTTPKKFMSEKKPTTEIERLVCLAYYLTHHRETAHFKTADLTALNTEAAGMKFTNPAQTGKDAMKGGHLAQAGRGKRQISAKGEALVEALPDRDAVKNALAEHATPRKRRAASKASK